jgi:hypothetical protein
MNILIISIFLTCLLHQTYTANINQGLLIEKYGFSMDSDEIDLCENSIDNIDINTFKGYNKLEKLYLEEKKLTQIECGLFNHLSNLRELWLESNNIVLINKNVFVGLNKLEKVCLNNNPISALFPSNLRPLCEPNPNCIIKINEKYIKD